MSNHNLEVYLSSLKLLHPNSTTNQKTTKITHTERFIAEQTSLNDKDHTKVESKVDLRDTHYHGYRLYYKNAIIKPRFPPSHPIFCCRFGPSNSLSGTEWH